MIAVESREIVLTCPLRTVFPAQCEQPSYQTWFLLSGTTGETRKDSVTPSTAQPIPSPARKPATTTAGPQTPWAPTLGDCGTTSEQK